MNTDNIPVKGVVPGRDEDKSRNVLANHEMWSKFFPIMNFIMFILGLFTVPIEVLFRRDFGQRWFTAVNFYGGLIVMLLFTFVQYLIGKITDSSLYRGFMSLFYSDQSENTESSFWDYLSDNNMRYFLYAYMLFSSYHFFRIWWRNHTNTALHSFDDGTSRLEPLSKYFMRLVNFLAIPFIRMFMLLLPKQERRRGNKRPKLVNDLRVFTNTVFEPLFVLILAFQFHGTARIWLFISTVALLIYSNWKETAKLNKFLDFRDAVIEAEGMKSYRLVQEEGTENETRILRQAAVSIGKTPEVAPQMVQQYPDLMAIIEEMNSERRHKTK